MGASNSVCVPCRQEEKPIFDRKFGHVQKVNPELANNSLVLYKHQETSSSQKEINDKRDYWVLILNL